MASTSRRKRGRKVLAEAIKAMETWWVLTGHAAYPINGTQRVVRALSTIEEEQCVALVLRAYGGWIDTEILADAIKCSRLPLMRGGGSYAISRMMSRDEIKHRWRGARLEVRSVAAGEDNGKNESIAE